MLRLFGILVVLLVGLSACRERQPEASSGLLDANQRVSVACTDAAGKPFLVEIAGWNLSAGEGLPVDIDISSGSRSMVVEPAIVHHEPNRSLAVVFKSGGMQTEYVGTKYVGILEVAGQALAEVQCQLPES